MNIDVLRLGLEFAVLADFVLLLYRWSAAAAAAAAVADAATAMYIHGFLYQCVYIYVYCSSLLSTYSCISVVAVVVR